LRPPFAHGLGGGFPAIVEILTEERANEVNGWEDDTEVPVPC